jgi:hypothetical protein
MTRRARLLGVLLLGVLLGQGRAEEAAKAVAIGDKVPNGSSLRDLRGSRRPLHGFSGHKAVVVAFVGTECPVANLYLPHLLEMEKKYRPQGVLFLAAYPNDAEDLDQIAAHAYDRDVPFPVLKDAGQKLAGLVGAARVPTVAVLDGDFVLRYRGRVDDRYGTAFRRPKATRDDLAQAIDEVLAGKKVSVAETEADGCLIDRGGKEPAKKDVTFAKHVAPILQKRCQACHRPEQAAPFSLLTYEDAAKHARTIREVTAQRRMPPWHADGRFGHFANDRRMTREEIDTVAAWVDAGMPRGDERDLPKPIDWPKGWLLGKPDLVLTMPEEFEVPATGSLPYKHYVIETKFTEDKWVKTAEARPGVPGVVHHIVAYILPDGRRPAFQIDGTLAILVGWAPGDLGLVCPPDTALRVPKGARLRMEMHYTPNGTAAKDRSSIGITFADKPPKYELYTNAFANESIRVPPYDPHYRAEASLRLPADARIISAVPHMHWRGKDYFYEIIHTDGKRETILAVPRWDFNWQNVYYFKEPVKLPKGARLHAVAHWDNSTNNPYNPAPDKAVRFGLQTWDEMMVGWVAYVWERPETAAELAKQPPNPADAFFDRLDRNGDDAITSEEWPEQMKPGLALAGIELPEKVTRKDFGELFEQIRKRFEGMRPRPKPEEKKP